MAGQPGPIAVRSAWLIAYDIRDPKRLARIGHAVARLAFRLQDSLYAADMTEAEQRALAARLQRLIDTNCDDLRFYRIPKMLFGSWYGPDPEASAPETFLFCSQSATLVFDLRRQNMNNKRT
jgi:CRISPR-associated protein Cas2